MAGTNDFLPFGTASGANVLSQAAYAALAARTSGFSSGTAQSAALNKAWRQSSFVTSAIAQWMANQTNTNIYDDGNQSEFITNFVKALAATGRIRLTGNLTIYVATTGSDSANTGLSVGSPFLTLQHAWSFLQQNYDLNGYSVTIQVADGTYTAGVSCNSPLVGATAANSVTFVGDTTTPTNCVINIPAGGVGFSAALAASFSIQGFALQSTAANALGIYASTGGTIYLSGVMYFGAFSGSGAPTHMLSDSGGSISLLSNYTIAGGAYAHYDATGRISNAASGLTITVSGTPAFSGAFALAQYSGLIVFTATAPVFSGAATGVRYLAAQNGVIVTAGGGVNYFPGNSAGSSTTGGQYS